ncbi:hypothetical protein Y032_0195g1490 [Ancylostoma ceylanicum]|uniref:Peptidase A1 domain-containing protein n=1 Tax=Ancylostoma ceylanicum TaxID=53326 RepID=A0A016SPP3_9BILA|nr:hypothetical protein Y032_0195g1490 [Ancylostoma ceylanicum]
MNQQQFGVANSLGPFFGTAPMDGIFGLNGFNEYPNLNAPMPSVKHFMDKQQFTVWMNRRVRQFGHLQHGRHANSLCNFLIKNRFLKFQVAISKGAIGGYITYGAYDKTNCEPQIYYAPLAVANRWIVNIAGFSIGSFTRTANEHVRLQCLETASQDIKHMFFRPYPTLVQHGLVFQKGFSTIF